MLVFLQRDDPIGGFQIIRIQLRRHVVHGGAVDPKLVKSLARVRRKRPDVAGPTDLESARHRPPGELMSRGQ